MKLVALFCLCASVLLFGMAGVKSAGSQEVLPEQSALLTACQVARSLAAQQNLNMEHCRRVAEVTEGNVSLVTVKVKITGQGSFTVSTSLMKTVWSLQGVQVQAE